MRTELHFHLLPGVDDGPRDDGDAIELARLAVADGTRRVVVTPHARCVDFPELPPRTAQLRARLAEAGVPLQVLVGAELSPDDVAGLSDDELELAANGPPGHRWQLLEAPLFPVQPSLAAAAAGLRRRGYGVLIGHPERSPTTSAADQRDQVQLGSVLQVNASSLVGRHGSEARRAGLRIVCSGLPFLIASDAHSPSRPPLLTDAAEVLADAGVSQNAIREPIDIVPDRLLHGGLPAMAAEGRNTA